MRLLVSVRDAREAVRAVAGGAEVVDAKEPELGSLGPVAPATLMAIRAAVPSRIRLSAALGDMTSPEELARAFAALPARLAFLKIGFRGLGEARRVLALLTQAVDFAARLPGRPAVIAVAYADHARARSLTPGTFPYLVSESGADGLLLDTCYKDAGSLFQVIDAAQLATIGSALEADELSFAVGGSLLAEHLRPAAEAGATIFGVRGGVCRGGRSGEVDEDLVRHLAEAVKRERASSRP
ncbi:MAG TPA: (5-formylfuran-3-yl)methyl phosphate synthase [Gemmatimonadales bacterium]|nr:(5-formylfuran-3-yl)methyl phosphate synthase [Gemmatimonadales bacterium]